MAFLFCKRFWNYNGMPGKVLAGLCAFSHGFLYFLAVFAFTRSAKFSAKFTERGWAVSGMKTLFQMPPLQALKTFPYLQAALALRHGDCLSIKDVG